MRVDTNGNPSAAVNTAASSRSVEGALTKTRTAESPAVSDSSFTQTPDLLRLLSAVKDIPDIRSDAIADVVDRLATGELLNRQSIEETAQVLLDSQSIAKG